jgi:hypothetical protein
LLKNLHSRQSSCGSSYLHHEVKKKIVHQDTTKWYRLGRWPQLRSTAWLWKCVMKQNLAKGYMSWEASQSWVTGSNLAARWSGPRTTFGWQLTWMSNVITSCTNMWSRVTRKRFGKQGLIELLT